MIKNALVALLLSSLLVLPLQGQQPQKQQAKLSATVSWFMRAD